MTKVFKKDFFEYANKRLDLPSELDDFKHVLIQAAESGKYEPNNWLTPNGGKQDKKHQYDSIMHHILAHLRGELLDKDSGLDHRLHAACRLMMDYTRSKRNLKHPSDSIGSLRNETEAWTVVDNTSGNENRNVHYYDIEYYIGDKQVSQEEYQKLIGKS